METKEIVHKGQTLLTKLYYKDLNHEECQNIRKQYYEKPDFEEVKKELMKIANGGLKISNVTNYYFKDLMAKVKMHHSKWSIEEMFECDDLIRFFYAKTLDNDKVFPKNTSIIKNIETALRLGGKGVASKPSNFPLKTAREVIKQFNVNNNYYDFSCGWGVRMLASMSLGVNYFGTDPNYLLVDRLKQLRADYETITKQSVGVGFACQGSEIFIPELENKVGLAFSSPPYFDLEDYRIGEQSYKHNTDYESWKNNYLKCTMENIYKYLTQDGNLIININDYSKYKLVEDTINICEQVGFFYHGNLILENIQRPNSNGGFNDNSEKIMIFKKHK